MERSEIEGKVKKLVADNLSVQEDKVSNEAEFLDDLGADSLDVVELVMVLEDEFELEISDEEAEKLKTVNDVVEYIVAKDK